MGKRSGGARAYVSGGRVFFRGAAGGKVYALRVPPGLSADDCAAMARVGLASGQWPPAIAGAAGVRRYLADVAGVGLQRNGQTAGGDIIAGFLALIAGEVTAQWRRQCGQYLRDFAAFCGGNITAATQAQAAQWLAQAKAPATRAKKLIVCRRFWRRALPGRLCPFEGFRVSKAARAQTDIDYYPPAVRDKILEVATGGRDCLAVFIALLAGLRANEVARLDWGAIDLTAGRITAQSKRGAPRAIPIAARLRAALETVPAAKRRGPVTGLRDSEGLRRALMRLRRAWLRAGGSPSVRLSWQTMRHTFCSLLVQAGVSLDKVASWAGHNPAVSRAHYSRFVPLAGADADIDRTPAKPKKRPRAQ